MKFTSLIRFLVGLMLAPTWSFATISNMDTTITSLRFIGEYIVPYHESFKNTTIGGLSGIDYDRQNDIYYLLSDDRSNINPARFYTARIQFSDKGIDTIEFLNVHHLLQQNGQPYPSSKKDAAHSIDPEAIRYNPKTKQIVWTSEGERITNSNRTVLVNPAISASNLQGQFVDSFPLPENLIMTANKRGPRKNGTLEGITFSNDLNDLYVGMEEPLYEDGPRADVTKTNSWVRFFKYDVASKKNTAQYAYPLEPVARPANPVDEYKVNGISEILWLGDNKLLTIERSFSTGYLGCVVKVFVADLAKAENVIAVRSLKENQPVHPVAKKLLLNMDDLGILIDNIEGVTFGPDLPNGHKTLIFVSDDNFVPLEKTQFLLFEVIPWQH
jgi:hypothetical protein